jgi:uncharacterized protein with NRDE domain
MCTVIIKWKPGEYIIGANRDERADRQCDDQFKWRGNYFAPRDLKEGTWFGINQQGIFAAITNAPEGESDYSWPMNVKGYSRGLLVKRVLMSKSIIDAKHAILNDLSRNKYRGFNLVFGNNQELWLIQSDAYRRFSMRPLLGTCIITADWPVVDEIMGKQCCHRLDYIAKNIPRSARENLIENMYRILSYTADGKLENAVSVKDFSESHRTRSSCILYRKKGINIPGPVELYWTDKPPDEVPLKLWNSNNFEIVDGELR